MNPSAPRAGRRPVLAAALFAALTRAALAAESGAPVDTLASGSFSAIDQPQQTVLHDAAAYAALWTLHAAHEDPPAVAPVVDFAKDTVAAVFAGSQPNGGVTLTATDLKREGAGWRLRLELRKPGPDCIVTQVMTQPWALVRIPGSSQTVSVDIRETERSCRQ
jgi:hypothetical protein